MSKKSKTIAKNRRLAAKRSKKATMKAQYQRFAELGQNQKSKRSLKGLSETVKIANHPYGRCGNPGCERCFGIRVKQWLNKKTNKLISGHPHRIWIKWNVLQNG